VKLEAALKARKDAEDARKRAEDEVKLQADEALRKESEARKKAAEDKAKRDEEEKARKDAEDKVKLEAMEKVRKDAEDARKRAEDVAKFQAQESFRNEEEEGMKAAGLLPVQESGTFSIEAAHLVIESGSVSEVGTQKVVWVKSKYESSEKEERTSKKAAEKEKKEAILQRKKDKEAQRKSKKAAEKKEKKEMENFGENSEVTETNVVSVLPRREDADGIAKTVISSLVDLSPEIKESDVQTHEIKETVTGVPSELLDHSMKRADDKPLHNAAGPVLPSGPSAVVLRQQLEAVHRLQLQVDRVMQAERLAARAQELQNRIRRATASGASLTKAKHGRDS
jgi:hypothetical protein